MKVLADLARAARERPDSMLRVDPALAAPAASASASAPRSLARALEAREGIVAELKPASPTQGSMRALDDPQGLARSFLQAGALGISALTEPTRFGGSARLLQQAVAAGGPVLLKDFVVTPRQLDLAHDAGAGAVLLILPLLTPEHSEWAGPDEAVAAAHARGLEVLLEVYDAEGYRAAAATDADMLGVNNRDLRDDDLPVDPKRTLRVLDEVGTPDRPVLALSGADSPAHVRAALDAGARGVLVGTSLMRADDPVARLRELMEGLK